MITKLLPQWCGDNVYNNSYYSTSGPFNSFLVQYSTKKSRLLYTLVEQNIIGMLCRKDTEAKPANRFCFKFFPSLSNIYKPKSVYIKNIHNW